MSKGIYRNPRESMAALPYFMQPFFTWLTGMPLVGQSPLFFWSPLGLAACTVAEILLGLLIGVVALNGPLWGIVLFIPISWLLTTGGMRMFFAVIEHSCTHHIFNSKKIINRLAADIMSTVLWTQTYGDFKSEHAIHHRAPRMPLDPDTLFLNAYGFYAGMSPGDVVKQLVKTILSPTYHLSYFCYRIQSNVSGPKYRTLMSLGYLCVLLLSLSVFNIWWYWLVLWAFPLSILFQISLLINNLTEHRWPARHVDKRQSRSEVCFGRFCGDFTPAVDGEPFRERMWLWCVWWARVAFVHLPYRMFVLVGDLPQHDLHHRHPSSDWANAAYVRLARVMSGDKEQLRPFTDEWGTIVDHINACASSWDCSKLAVAPQLRRSAA